MYILAKDKSSQTLFTQGGPISTQLAGNEDILGLTPISLMTRWFVFSGYCNNGSLFDRSKANFVQFGGPRRTNFYSASSDLNTCYLLINSAIV